jgi:hypothetical protein
MRSLNMLLIIGIFTSLISCNSKHSINKFFLRSDVQIIVDSIAKVNTYEGARVGLAGRRSEQWRRYEELKKLATTDELDELTNHENPVVRCYSFKALLYRKNIDVLSIVKNHLNDNTSFELLSGDLGDRETVGDFFIEKATNNYDDLNIIVLTEKQRAVLDSTLLYDNTIELKSKYEYISKLKPDPKLYKRIREIAYSGQRPIAILALSRYKNKKDIALIKSLFDKKGDDYYAAYCSREFPDQTFYPCLVKLIRKEWNEEYYNYTLWRILYQALAKYPCQETYKLFEQTTMIKDSFRYQTLCKYLKISILKYPNKVYEPLKKKIKLDEFETESMEEEMYLEK